MSIVHFFKTLFRNNKSSNNNEDEFDREAYEKAIADDPLHPVYECRKLLEEFSEYNIVGLYDSIDAFLFQDIHLEKVISNIPKWVCDVGINSEGCSSKDFFLTSSMRHPTDSVSVTF